MKSRFATLNGQSFHYLEWGDPSAQKLLFLHGFPEYSGAWEELATRLAPEFHCIAPDQRGYGQSWAPHGVGDYATSKLVADMAALIETLGSPVTVIGHDWGSAVAYGLAMFMPGLVDRLVVLNGVHPVPFQRALAAGGAQAAASQYIHYLRADGSEDRLAQDDFAPLLRLFSAHMDLSWLSGDRLAAYKREWARPGRLRGMINWYRASPLQVPRPGETLTELPELPRDKLMVRCPHLLIWGMQDAALLPEACAGLQEFAPDLTRHEIADADHWLAHTHAEEVAGAIREWLVAQG